MLEIGMTGKKSLIVDYERTAARYGSGALEVYATPAMVALMEGTCQALVQPHLDEGKGTVGTEISVRHLAATPVGMQVTCEAELTEIDRRRLTFTVKVYDEKELVGEGKHERFIIDNEKFFSRVQSKIAAM
ncbi:MAG: thioesterase family protein [Mogibacterium sp.]|nr:thioesterase family protein [Mogibacterium sp.]